MAVIKKIRPVADLDKKEVKSEKVINSKDKEIFEDDSELISRKEVKSTEPKVEGSKSVRVEADKIADESIQIDFMSDSFSKDHAGKKTKEKIEEPKSSIPDDAKVSDIRDQIKKSEADRSGDKFTFKDIHQIATFLINAFDGGIAILLNFLAKDTAVSAYSLPVETKRQLSEQLALILVKYQVKFKIEFMFLITLILAYMGPVGGAMKKRKKSLEPKVIAKKEEVKSKKEEIKKEEPEKVEVVEASLDTVISRPPRTKRGKGGRKKAWNDN